ncbi:MAG: hypothetical protein M3M95_01680, partial [Pseudomonadota bacterium]|nr:hypothetical protein [Pseudomonadota bacterium]
MAFPHTPPPSRAARAHPGEQERSPPPPLPGEAAFGEAAGGRRRRKWLRKKRWIPTSLYGRALLIIILPIALMQIAVTYVFFEEHWRTVTGRLSQGLAGDIAWVVEE